MDLNDTHMIKPDIEYADNYVHNNSYMKGYVDGINTVLGVRIDRKQFEGMTNGEVLKSIFPTAELILGNSDHLPDVFSAKEGWWNSPYQKGGE